MNNRALKLWKSDPYRSSSHDPVILSNGQGIITGNSARNAGLKEISAFPNPAGNGMIYFTETISGEITDLTGKVMTVISSANSLDVSQFADGVYLLKTEERNRVRFTVK